MQKKAIAKRIFTLFATLFFCVTLCAAFTACGEQTESETKYDVAIRVACSDGEIYEFPVGEDERSVTIQYTGVERVYRVVKYQLVGFSNEWFDQNYSPDSPKNFTISILKGTESTGYEEADAVEEVGSYCILIESDYSSSTMNFRVCRLYINVRN